MLACLSYVLLTYVAAHSISRPASDAVIVEKVPVGSMLLVILLKTYIRETINHMLSYPRNYLVVMHQNHLRTDLVIAKVSLLPRTKRRIDKSFEASKDVWGNR